MADSKVDLEAGGPNLLVDLVAEALHEGGDGILERRVRVFGRGDALLQFARLGVLEKPLEDARPLSLCPVEINVAGSERNEDLASAARSSKEHVETALASFCGDRAEGHAIEARPGDAWTVSDGNENDVTLIALDVFEVLHEYVFVLSLAQ